MGELEGEEKLFKVKHFKYRWSLYYNKAVFYLFKALFPPWKVPSLAAPHSADVLGNFRSYLGLSFEEAQGQPAVILEEVCRFKIQLDLFLNLKKKKNKKQANKKH